MGLDQINPHRPHNTQSDMSVSHLMMNQPLPLNTASAWAPLGMQTLTHLGLCLISPPEPRCLCPGHYHGPRCSLGDNPCASQPCTQGAVCTPKPVGYFCNCSQDNPGARWDTLGKRNTDILHPYTYLTYTHKQTQTALKSLNMPKTSRHTRTHTRTHTHTHTHCTF